MSAYENIKRGRPRKEYKDPVPDAHYCDECRHFEWSLRTSVRLEDGYCTKGDMPLHTYHAQRACGGFEYDPTRKTYR